VHIVSFDEDFKPGVARGEWFVDVSDIVERLQPPGPLDRINTLLEHYPQIRSELIEAFKTRAGIYEGRTRRRAPNPRPRQIQLVNDAFPTPPALSVRALASGESLWGADDQVTVTGTVTCAACFAMVIGREGQHPAPELGLEMVFGFSGLLHLQSSNGTLQMALGPILLGADDRGDPERAFVRMWVDGQLQQEYNTASLSRSLAQIIAEVSREATLQPGDLVVLGPATPPVKAEPGATIRMSVERAGDFEITLAPDS
jgi:hypothetical protein